jgi:olefin beta-lactone synthetase
MNDNITNLFFKSAQERMARRAITDRRSGEWTYSELLMAVKGFAAMLDDKSLTAGDRVVLLVQPSVELYGAAIAVLAKGMTVVLIDPSIGLKNALATMKRVSVKAVIAQEPISLLLKALPPMWGYRIISASAFKKSNDVSTFTPVPSPRGEAIISFTSGSTGSPKGANRTHDLLLNQHQVIKRYWGGGENSTDLTFFPVLGFHSLCIGSTLAIPGMKLKDPERAEKLLAQLSGQRISRLAAPPGFIMELAEEYARSPHELALDTYVVGGTAVSPRVTQKMANVLPFVRGLVVYGSTEVEPMAIATAEQVSESSGLGYLLGQPIQELKCDIRQIDKLVPLPNASEGRIGELLVDGPHALKSYFTESYNPTPIAPPLNTGDVVIETDDGNLWILGRTADMIANSKGYIIPHLLIESELIKKTGCDVAVVATSEGSVAIFESDATLNGAELAAIKNDIESLYGIALTCRMCRRLPRDKRQFSKIDRIALRRDWKKLYEVA